eukprot:768203-Hanusia_phi.AAC.8
MSLLFCLLASSVLGSSGKPQLLPCSLSSPTLNCSAADLSAQLHRSGRTETGNGNDNLEDEIMGPPPGDLREPTRMKQWKLEVTPDFAGEDKARVEGLLGYELTEYLPNNSFVITASPSRASQLLTLPGVTGVGERSLADVVDEKLASAIAARIEIEVRLLLVPDHMRGDDSIEQVARSIESDWLLVTGDRIGLSQMSRRVLAASVRSHLLQMALGQMPRHPHVMAVELQPLYLPRNQREDKILVSGPSLQSELSDGLLLLRNALTGTGQVVAVADTGLDYDNCMLWQPPFPWFCLNPARASAGAGVCSASAYAGLLANKDFSSFVSMMIFSSRDRELLDSGSTVGVPSRFPPLNAIFRNRADRIQLGYVFSLNGDSTISLLLDSWTALRPDLLLTLQVGQQLCAACGGNVTWANGVQIFETQQTYSYDPLDNTTQHLKALAGSGWNTFSALLVRNKSFTPSHFVS